MFKFIFESLSAMEVVGFCTSWWKPIATIAVIGIVCSIGYQESSKTCEQLSKQDKKKVQKSIEFSKQFIPGFASAYSVQGNRETMEDTFVGIPMINNNPRHSFYAVFDGHGGSKSADYAANHLHKILFKMLNDIQPQRKERNEKEAETTKEKEKEQKETDTKQNTLDTKTDLSQFSESEIKLALSLSFKTLDDKILLEKTIVDGTTAVCALIIDTKIYIANVGDSRAVLSHQYYARRLSHDHKPSDPEERKRIESNKGIITFHGVPRVEGLAISRSLGDHFAKKYVISEPNITVHSFYEFENDPSKLRYITNDGMIQTPNPREDDVFLILSTDGLSDVIDDQTSANIIYSHCENCDSRRFASLAAHSLIDNALKQKSNDNITVLVIPLFANCR